MSSAADSKEWTMSGLWAIQKNTEPSSSQPGAALPNKTQRGIAGQISEHLNYVTRRPAATRAPSEDTPAPGRAPSTAAAAESTLSTAAQQAPGASDDQKITPAAAGTPYLTFRLGKVRWGIPVIYLREALPDVPPITPLPFSPIWLHGLINLRGESVGLINLSDLLLDPVIAASTARADAAMPVVVAEHEGVSLALQVQELGEVIFLEESQFRHLSGAHTRSLPAFAVSHLQAAWFSPQGQPLLLLDLPRLMASLLEQMTAQEALGDG
ncbi:MAG TPA: chemotaxis protein CheW [Ktedonobacterales bacterium]|nr:chemotaxis protein CheW [Ktedonobacterales bacterium]